MDSDGVSNSYEEARQRRLKDNKRRFQDLGILKISKSLSDLSKSEKTSPCRSSKQKSKIDYTLELRRSSRTRNPVRSYCEDVDIELPNLRKRSKSRGSWACYLARPLNEVRIASYDERVQAIKTAEELQRNLQSSNPSFVKSMGFPSSFCEDHLPKTVVDMILEDEDRKEYEAIYIGKRTGLSGGWRAFALDHKLDDGDALVFELVEPARFKIYIVRVYELHGEVTKNEETPSTKGYDGPKLRTRKQTAKYQSLLEC